MTVDPIAVVALAFPGREVRPEGEGQVTQAYRVGDELLVRIPKHRFGVERLEFEVRLLDAVRPRMTVAVPDVVEVALDRPVGEAFVAHRLIPGRVVRRELLRRWPIGTLRIVAARVAMFLKELHPLVGTGLAAGAPLLPPSALAASLRREVDDVLAPRASDSSLTRARHEIAGLDALADEPTALCHTDLGGNVVFDEENESVGVIDFGSCAITHPALDVASLSVLGDEFLNECARDYPLLASMGQDAAAVRRTFVLQDALYGARQEEWSYVDGILRDYE